MYKLRNIAFQKSGEPIKGITIPNEIAEFFEQTSFSIEKSGTTIILTSGTQIIARKEIESYKFQDCRL